MVENAIDTTNPATRLSLRDRDYYDGHQWTQDQINILKARKQPIITNNRIKMKVDGLIGIEQRSRVDPRALPRNPQDEQAADAVTKALVYVDDASRFDVIRSSAFENILVEGIAGAEVIVQPSYDGSMEVIINRLRFEEIVYDPASREKDFSDASFKGYQKWLTVDEVVDTYADTFEGTREELETMLSNSLNSNETVNGNEDRPFTNNQTNMTWFDKKSRRVRLATIYYCRSGVWYLAIFTSSGEIINKESPYLDEHGNPICPIHLMSAYVDRNNNRYGLARSMISLQDEINARYSKLLHYFNSRQTVAIKGAIDASTIKNELAKPDGHIELDLEVSEALAQLGIKPFEMLNTTDQSSGQFGLLQQSINALDNIGPNPALMGASGQGQSGRAIMAQQQAALSTVSPIFDSLREWTISIYRAIWQRVRQYWTDEKMFRVLDEENSPQFIRVNVITGMQPVINQETGEIVMQPIIENELALMDMDITIEDIPDYVSLKSEQFEQLSNLAARGINIPVEMIIESASIQNKQKLLQIVKAQNDAAAEQHAIALQMQQEEMAFQREQKAREFELRMKELELEIAKTQSQIAVNNSSAALNVTKAEQTLVETTNKELNIAKNNL